MKCVKPIKIRDPVTGIIKILSCQKCVACVQNRRSGWFLRLKNEEKRALSVWFITLTYDDENLPIGKMEIPTLVKSDLQKFFKRLRKMMFGSKSKGKYFKYYAVGEYGDKVQRPHYHIILFLKEMEQKQISDYVEKCWKMGRNQVEPAGIGSYGYVAGYIIGSLDDHYVIPKEDRFNDRVFACMSKGIGEEYINKWKEWHKEDYESRSYSVIEDGVKVPLPRYYKDKIFKEEEKRIQVIENKNREIEKLKLLSKHEIAENQRLKQDRIERYGRIINSNDSNNRKI